MTLDEAIKYHEDMAEINECAAKMLSDDAFLHMDFDGLHGISRAESGSSRETLASPVLTPRSASS